MNSTTLSFTLPLHGLRSRLLNWGFRISYPIYAKLWKRPRPAWQLGRDQLLMAYDPESLGFALGCFLNYRDLDLMPGFESHDVFHTLLGYGTSAPEEVMLQWCLLGNGKRSPYCFFAASIGALCFPEHWGLLRAAYQRGRQLRTFHHWYFEYLLQEDLTELRAFLNGKAKPSVVKW